MVMVFVAIILLAGVSFFLYTFATSDGDLSLLRQGPALRPAVQDKVVWITGASQGIGECLAKEFARLGAKLILSSRRVAELDRVKAGLSGKNVPDGVVVLPLDLAADVGAIREAVDKAEAAFDGAGVDYIVHNASFPRPKLAALEVPEETIKAIFDVNVIGTIALTRSLVPAMIRRGKGHVVLVSSVAGKIPSPAQTVYAASKHAVNGYFHSLRAEVGQKGIKVTVVCPGPIDTSNSTSEKKPIYKKSLLSEARMPATRCAELIVIAATHGLKEAWISYHPVLMLLYLMQYFPSAGYAILDKIGPNRVNIYKEGKDAYSASMLFGQSSKKLK